MVSDDDPMARTATAPGASASASSTLPPLGDSLGRYRLQRELGAGGMGVVHAAFDPDLERRVALKVLRASDTPEARQRLLREARAMARLTHPNVVTVHEVGSATGRDYVAMELIDGGTLEDWLREKTPPTREIVSAFMAAGRGLAAAHAAGLVHRDFKPRNVLRHTSGRIVVTDFGLVLGVEAAAELGETLRISQAKISATAQSSSTLTATGSLLGTPAYMAPEQWSGAAVGPPADQFAFCVALWEALAGERPFQGDTLDTLKTAIEKGPDALDDSKVPRRFRKALRRGLARDPAQRWPSMTALLTAIGRAERGPGVVLAIAGAAVVAGAIALLMISSGSEARSCEAPLKDPSLVWPTPPPSSLANQPLVVAAIDRDMRAWRAVRERTCKLDDSTRKSRLACLDGVLARIELLTGAVAAVGGTTRLSVTEELIAPAVCEAARPPRLATGTSPEMLDVLTTALRASLPEERFEEVDATKLLERAAREPCAAAAARLLAVGTRKSSASRSVDLDEAERDAQRCGDDRLLADVALITASVSLTEGAFDLAVRTKLRRAEVAVEAVTQPDLAAQLELLRASVALRSDDIDEALRRTESARQLYEAGGRPAKALSVGLNVLRYRQLRAKPEDLAMIEPTLAELRAAAAKLVAADDELLRQIDETAAWWQFSSGDAAGAHAKIAAHQRQLPVEKPMRIVGRVVDEQGKPVAGVSVAAGPFLYGDSISAWLPHAYVRTATTGADGRFAISEAASDGVVIAEDATRRSAPVATANEVTLTLAPTSRLEGKVDLRGEPSTKVTVMVRDPAMSQELPYWGLRAPVRPDGSFTLDGVGRGRMLVQTHVGRSTTTVIAGQQVTVTEPVMTLQLAVQVSKRVVHVIARSTVSQPFTLGQAIVLPGVVPSTNLQVLQDTLASANVKNLRPIIGENAPPAVMAKAKAGDLYATIPEVPEGPVSACAVGLPPNISDESFEKQLRVPENRARIQIPCVQLGPADDVAILEVPPWPRFD